MRTNKTPAIIPQYIGRFAPSPTGPLHFGSMVACLASYLDTRAHGGKWLLRIEDVDTTRSRADAATQIIDTLGAFGFTWDGEPVYQLQRTDRYQAALDQLAARHLVYGCNCSRREIADSALAGIEGPVYPGTCRNKGLPVAADTAYAVRVLTDDAEIGFHDRVQGDVSQRLTSAIGDFVLKRRDGVFAYQLAVVVDDAEQKVSDVVRGADLLDSTPRQIYLQRLLGVDTPRYLHIPIVTNVDGQKLSKQTLAPAIDAAAACDILCDALSFLGQSTTAARQMTAPGRLLAAAAESWQPDAIPRVRASHILRQLGRT